MSRRPPIQPKSKSNSFVAALVTSFALLGFAGSFWIVYYKNKTNPIDSSKALPDNTQWRGQYIRAGTKDVGPDPTYNKTSPWFDGTKKAPESK